VPYSNEPTNKASHSDIVRNPDIAAFLDSWPDAMQALITGRFPMEAHRDLLLGRSGGIKNVIKLN